MSFRPAFRHFSVLLASLIACTATIWPQPAIAAGDLLVAPTRVELNGFRGTEVVLNNIGSEAATYRVSLELRRMTPEGQLEEVTTPTEAETIALNMISYAPRRVRLEPNQPQVIRIGVRPPTGLPDGEYRVHMLFRAVPDAQPAGVPVAAGDGISINLTPIYGITIPIIVRSGQLSATAAISDAKLVTENGRQAVTFQLSRAGTRSLFGDVRITKPGQADPVILARGLAVYTEVTHRSVTLMAPQGFTGSLAGPAKIQYLEHNDQGTGAVLAEAEVVLH